MYAADAALMYEESSDEDGDSVEDDDEDENDDEDGSVGEATESSLAEAK